MNLNLDLPDEPWMAHAACRGAEPDIFFPGAGDGGQRAKAICARCPVTLRCLDYALAWGAGPLGGTSPHQTDHGVYGGTTPTERHQLRRGSAG